MNTATKIIVSIGSIAVIATAGIGGFLLATKNDAASAIATTTSSVTPASTAVATTTPTSDTTSTAVTPASTPTTANTSGYKDGTYTANTSYRVPHGGSNTISASVTVSGGKITAVTANDNYTDGESAMYVDSFESSLSSSVVGTSLANANFSRIGGASLTTSAFDSALDTIRTQATA